MFILFTFSVLGMVLAVGISNLQYVDLNSSRNLTIVGLSIFMGLVVPHWAKENAHVIQTGMYGNGKTRFGIRFYHGPKSVP